MAEPIVVRVRFEKRGAIRFTSHKDVIRMLQRCFAACGVPVRYSQGFHPHMKLSFAPPVKTGWEGRDEYLDVHLERKDEDLAQRCNACLPEGLRIVAARRLEERAPKLAVDITAAEMEARIAETDFMRATGGPAGEDALGRLAEQARERFSVSGAAQADVERETFLTRVIVERINGDVAIRYVTTARAGKIVTPDEIVASVVGDPAAFRVPLRVTRIAQFVERDGRYVSPMTEGVVSSTS